MWVAPPRCCLITSDHWHSRGGKSVSDPKKMDMINIHNVFWMYFFFLAKLRLVSGRLWSTTSRGGGWNAETGPVSKVPWKRCPPCRKAGTFFLDGFDGMECRFLEKSGWWDIFDTGHILWYFVHTQLICLYIRKYKLLHTYDASSTNKRHHIHYILFLIHIDSYCLFTLPIQMMLLADSFTVQTHRFQGSGTNRNPKWTAQAPEKCALNCETTLPETTFSHLHNSLFLPRCSGSCQQVGNWIFGFGFWWKPIHCGVIRWRSPLPKGFEK